MNLIFLSRYLLILVVCKYPRIVYSQPNTLKALDFSLDNDEKPDENNLYTHASLQKENLPSSFTICTAFMTKAWAGSGYDDTSAKFVVLHDDKGGVWCYVKIFAAEKYTEFSFLFEDTQKASNQSKTLFYPFEWTRVCLSKDSKTSLARMVVDGELLVEKRVRLSDQPDNLNLVLGKRKTSEYPGIITNVNIFSSALSTKQMKLQTKEREGKCGLEGDFLSWKKSLVGEEWTLHSKARWVDIGADRVEDPCRAKAKTNVFPMNEMHHQSDCMEHCKKLLGHSPSVKTRTEWENLLKEIKAVSPDLSKLPEKIWLSATEGDIAGELGNPDHWPEGVEAEEGVWRDYYTGEQLENYTKPWESSNGDKEVAEAYNCVQFYPMRSRTKTWKEWLCQKKNRGCPCTYDSLPLIHMRGLIPCWNIRDTQ